MGDAWDEIQAIKSKRNSYREKLEKRKKERQDLLSYGVAPIVNNKIDCIDDSTTVGLNTEIDSDIEVEKIVLELLSKTVILLPINSAQLASKVEKILECAVNRDAIHYVLKKLSTQSINLMRNVSIYGEPGYELLIVNQRAVSNLYNDFMIDTHLSKVQKQLKRKHESEEDDENSRKSFKLEKRYTSKESSNDASDIMSLLSMPSTREKQSKQVGEEILELLTKPTAKERSLAEKFKSHGGAQVMEFCPHGTRIECLRAQQTTAEMTSVVIGNCKSGYRRLLCSKVNLKSSNMSSDDDEETEVGDEINDEGDDIGNSDEENGDDDINNTNNDNNGGKNEGDNNDGDEAGDDGNIDGSIDAINNCNDDDEDKDETNIVGNGSGGICNNSADLSHLKVVNVIEENLLVNSDDQEETEEIGVIEVDEDHGEYDVENNLNMNNNHSNSKENDDCEQSKTGNIIDRCKKLHFKKIIQTHTDESLGDCSFLNTCFHMTTCKYVHYEVDMNSSSGSSHRHDDVKGYSNAIVKCAADPSATLYPPQWIQCDLRYLDMTVLGKFAVVMADPPWDIHMELPYGTMSDDEMRQLGVPALQDDGLIFLWVTGRAMELGRECLKLWGYERVDELIWVKTNQLQRIIRTGRTGHWLNHGKEHCLVGMKGNPKNLNRGLDCDVIVAEVRATSHKPDEIYGIIERLSPGTRKIELFGRPHNVQPNWITLGNQLDGIRLVDPELIAQFQKRYPDGNCMAPATTTTTTSTTSTVKK